MPQALRLRESRFDESKGQGPTLLAVAITSKPHLPQRGKEVKLIDVKGDPYAEVPVYKLGKYRHPFWGAEEPLNFDEKFTKNIMKNHAKKVTAFNVALDFRHGDDQGSLAFLDPEDGGWLEMKDDWLYAYGPVVDDESLSILKSRRWRFTSPEIHLDYRSTKLSSDGSGAIRLESLFEQDKNFITQLSQYEEKVMYELIIGGQTIKLEDAEGGGFTIQQSVLDGVKTAFDAVQASLDKKSSELVALTAQVEELKKKITPPAQDPPVNLESLPAEFRTVFQQMQEQVKLAKEETDRQRREAAEQRKQRNLERVAAALSKAKALREKGKGHPAVFLETMKAALTFSPIGANGSTVKLETTGNMELTAEQVMDYAREAFLVILETTPPSVQMEQTVDRDEDRPAGGDGFVPGTNATKEEVDAAIADYEKKWGGSK
jgi:hypothetical protein